jgi:hypothetical protein
LATAAATRVAEPSQRLAALEKVRVDFPTYTTVDQQILTTLVNNFADRQPAIADVFDRMVGRIPLAATPDVRLAELLVPINIVVGKGLLLDRSEPLLVNALTAFDVAAYGVTRAEIARRLNQPPPTKEQITTAYNAAKARALETIGRVRLAKGDTVGAETPLKEAWRLGTFGTAAATLIATYVARNDYASAEKLLTDAIARALAVQLPPAPPPARPGDAPARPPAPIQPPPSAANAQRIALANLYLKKGDDAKADSQFHAVVAATPTNRAALVGLARLEDRRGDSKQALDRIATVAVAGSLAPDEDVAFHAIYAKVKGSDAGLDANVDSLYRAKYPNPVTTDPWKPSPKRSDRVTLLELFTGAGCGPCVGADVALDAVLQRYPREAVIALAYHANVPAPDPMVVSAVEGRRLYYSVHAVPTMQIDGGLGRLGGGSRSAATGIYGAYVRTIDKSLETLSQASIDVSAVGAGDKIDVTTRIAKLPAAAKGLRLHVLLVEEQLRYTGENGIRFHPMVVRAAMGDHGTGIPISADGTIHSTFSLAEVRADVAGTLTQELDRRMQAAPAGASPHYAADGHAYTAIDSTRLMIVAFVQSGNYDAPTLTAAELAAAGVDLVDAAEAPAAGPKPAAKPPVGSALAMPSVLQAARAVVVFKK